MTWVFSHNLAFIYEEYLQTGNIYAGIQLSYDQHDQKFKLFFPNRQSLFGPHLPPYWFVNIFFICKKCVRLRQIDIMFQVYYTKSLKSGSSIISGILESIHFLKTFTIPTSPYFIIL